MKLIRKIKEQIRSYVKEIWMISVARPNADNIININSLMSG